MLCRFECKNLKTVNRNSVQNGAHGSNCFPRWLGYIPASSTMQNPAKHTPRIIGNNLKSMVIKPFLKSKQNYQNWKLFRCSNYLSTTKRCMKKYFVMLLSSKWFKFLKNFEKKNNMEGLKQNWVEMTLQEQCELKLLQEVGVFNFQKLTRIEESISLYFQFKMKDERFKKISWKVETEVNL